jgi:small-conductance mechanosensitive channel
MAIFLMISQIPGMKQLSNTLLAGAGILVAAIGFGSQQAISNIVSGIFMVIFKPFHVGDNIILSGDTRGTVIDISLRHTTIKNNENNVIIIQNTVLNNQSIVNFSAIEVNSCAHVEVSISYSANIDKAIQLIQEEALKHRFLIDKRSEADKENGAPQVIVRVLELTKLSVDLRAWAWAENYVNAFILKCELLKSIKERFDKEGIELAMINPTKVHFSEVE